MAKPYTVVYEQEVPDNLNDLDDVVLAATPADNDIFAYDSTTGKFINQTAAQVGIPTTSLVPLVLSDSFADVSVGGAEADIFTYTTAASRLSANGQKITALYGINFVTVGTELTQLQVYFGGTAIYDSTGVAPTTGTTSAIVNVTLIRVSSTVVRYSVVMTTTTGSTYVYAKTGELTGLTLSNTNILKITGTSTGVGAGAGDIVGKMSTVTWLPAA